MKKQIKKLMKKQKLDLANNIETFIEAKRRYYTTGDTLMEDCEYDAFEEFLRKKHPEHNGLWYVNGYRSDDPIIVKHLEIAKKLKEGGLNEGCDCDPNEKYSLFDYLED